MAWLGTIFGASSGGGGGSEFVGQYVDLGKQKLRIKRVLAEGGYGFVFIAQDIATNKEYALKRLMAADDATSKVIVKEVSFLRKLRGHPNIVQYIGAASGEENKDHTIKEYLILTELCTGQLIEFLQSQGVQQLPFDQVLKIFSQLVRAVVHIHKQTPPIIHRDIKIENMLFSSKGVIKVCDFGSATVEAIYPDSTWSALQRNMAEDEIQRNTTPMYRAPEMIDLYSNYPITIKADIWALGCVLYYLCFMTHPFEDSAKLKIMNANYTIPESDTVFTDFHHLIKSMLKVNPDDRANAEDIYANLISLGLDRNVDIKGPIFETPSATAVMTETEQLPGGIPGNNYGSSVLLGNVVNKAGALFSNIKDVSSKVMSTMAGYAKSDLDISYITSRLLVMSFPADGIEGTYKNNIDDVRVYMDSKHADGYIVMNISQRTYRSAKLNDRVYDCGWNPKRSPSLEKLVSLCRKLNNYLKQNKSSVVVIHCLDGKVASALLLCSFFLFCKLFSKLSMAVHLFNLKRCPVEEPVVFTPSQKRYCTYVGQLLSSSRSVPHNNIVFLKSISISPIPIFNKARTGCRPFIEIFQNEKRIFNTAKEIEEMREYTVEDNKIVFQTHVRLHGDITLLVHHGRSTLGGKVQGKLTSINILSLQFHTGFLMLNTPNAMFSLNELDILEPDADRYPANFGVCLNLKFTDETPEKITTMPWEKMHVEKLSPYVCFSSREEYWLIHEEFGLSEDIGVDEGISTSSEGDGSSSPKMIPASENENIIKFDHDEAGDGDSMEGNPQVESKPLPVSSIETSNLTDDLISISPTMKPDIIIEDNFRDPIASDFSPFAQPIQSGGDSLIGDLIDPFDLLGTSQNTKVRSENSGGNGCLLNFGREENGTTKESQSFTPGFDLINSIHESNVKHTSPDIVPDIMNENEFVPIKKNRSLDDINADDLFSKLDEHSKLSTGGVEYDNAIPYDKPKQTVDPFMKHFHNSPRKSNSESNLLSDVFGDNLGTGYETLTPEIQHANSAASLNKESVYDPFSEFGNLGSDAFGSMGGFQKPQATAMSGGSSMTSGNTPRLSPIHFNQSVPPSTSAQPKSNVSPNYNVFVTPFDTGMYPSKPPTKTSTNSGWAPKPMKSNQFDDLLDAQGFVKTSNSETKPSKSSLKEMRNALEDQHEVDPVKRKIRDWSDGKERNIRALLTSLPTVLWEGHKWKPIGIHQIMQGNEVKKFYQKACLVVHPDKHVDEPHEALARAIFVELNVSWGLFKDSGAMSL